MKTASANVVCDIIILTLDQVEVLRPCVESVLKHTKVPCCVTVVNNGGGKNVRDFFDSLKPTENIYFKYYEFPENIGFVKGNNIAALGGSAPYVCLLNNDCVVTEGWLERMIELSEKNPKFAAINPQSDTLITHEGLVNLPLEERSRNLEKFKGQYYVLGSAVGFCMLIPRRVIKQIGLFDEGIDTAYFEDSDFSYRAREAGFECVIAADAYVYHQPFAKASSIPMKKRQELIARNRKWFEKKWGKAVRLAIIYDHKNGSDAALTGLFECAKNFGLYDNHPHLILNVERKRFPNLESLLSFLRFDRSQSPNLKVTLLDTGFFWVYAFFRAAFKWRKRYDVIACDKIWFLKRLAPFRSLLRFWLVYLEPSGVEARTISNILQDGFSRFIDRFYLRGVRMQSLEDDLPKDIQIRVRELGQLTEIRKEKRDANKR